MPGFLSKLHYSEAQTGYVLSFISLVALFSALLVPKVMALCSEKTTLSLAFVTYTFAHLLLATSGTLPIIILASVCTGIGFGLSIPLLNHATVERSTEQNRGRNLSYFAMAVFTGQFLTSALEFLPLAHSATLLICAGIAVLGALATQQQRVAVPSH